MAHKLWCSIRWTNFLENSSCIWILRRVRRRPIFDVKKLDVRQTDRRHACPPKYGSKKIKIFGFHGQKSLCYQKTNSLICAKNISVSHCTSRNQIFPKNGPQNLTRKEMFILIETLRTCLNLSYSMYCFLFLMLPIFITISYHLSVYSRSPGSNELTYRRYGTGLKYRRQ